MTTHTDINVALARVLGIDPESNVIAFTVDVDKDRFPLVTVTRRHRESLEDTTEAFKLVSADEDEADEAAG